MAFLVERKAEIGLPSFAPSLGKAKRISVDAFWINGNKQLKNVDLQYMLFFYIVWSNIIHLSSESRQWRRKDSQLTKEQGGGRALLRVSKSWGGGRQHRNPIVKLRYDYLAGKTHFDLNFFILGPHGFCVN